MSRRGKSCSSSFGYVAGILPGQIMEMHVRGGCGHREVTLRFRGQRVTSALWAGEGLAVE